MLHEAHSQVHTYRHHSSTLQVLIINTGHLQVLKVLSGSNYKEEGSLFTDLHHQI